MGAWTGVALYSLTNAYAATGRSDFLAAAEKVANFYVSHLPADDIPYWDFNAKVTSTTPRDTSAAAVATSALLKLASLTIGTTEGTSYKQAAEARSTRSARRRIWPKARQATASSCTGRWVAKGDTDNSLVFGDYYFLEALNRYATLTITFRNEAAMDIPA